MFFPSYEQKNRNHVLFFLFLLIILHESVSRLLNGKVNKIHLTVPTFHLVNMTNYSFLLAANPVPQFLINHRQAHILFTQPKKNDHPKLLQFARLRRKPPIHYKFRAHSRFSCFAVNEWHVQITQTMYSVVGHHSYGRGDRRHQNRQQQSQNVQQNQHGHNASQSQLQSGSNFSISSKRRNSRNRHRESLTLRFINYIRRRFNPVVGEYVFCFFFFIFLFYGIRISKNAHQANVILCVMAYTLLANSNGLLQVVKLRTTCRKVTIKYISIWKTR